MKYLLAGSEPKARLHLMLKLTDITSENIISALEDHLVKGDSLTYAASMNEVPKGNLSRNVKTLNGVAEIIERVKDIDYRKKLSVE